jgi:hypothetical protein
MPTGGMADALYITHRRSVGSDRKWVSEDMATRAKEYGREDRLLRGGWIERKDMVQHLRIG